MNKNQEMRPQFSIPTQNCHLVILVFYSLMCLLHFVCVLFNGNIILCFQNLNPCNVVLILNNYNK